MSQSLDMADQEVDYILNYLVSSRTGLSPALLNNLIYYLPRIKSLPKLTKLINATFNNASRFETNALELFDAAQAIAQWKLQISEPIIPLSEFFGVWDSCFAACHSWTRPKLALIAGILSTKESFFTLQANSFIDGTGQVGKLYEGWERSIFIPTWCELLKNSRRDQSGLVLIYSAVAGPSDGIRYSYIPWDAVTFHLSQLLSSYMIDQSKCPEFFSRKLSQMARTLRTSLANSSITSINSFVSQICKVSYNLNFKEINSQMPNKDYSGKYYSGILFTIVISINSILQSAVEIPPAWYPQLLMTFLNINFIANDVGIAGFDSYESVYEVLCSGVTMTDDHELYYAIVETMRGNIWSNQRYPNKVNQAKLLFLLNFMGSTLSHISVIPPRFITHFITPMTKQYADSDQEDIRESVHVMMLSLFKNNGSSNVLLQWQARHFLEYIDLSTNQFMSGEISEKQLTMIYQEMSSRLPSLQITDKHLAREALHQTYLRILNSPPNENAKQAVLLKCIIYQSAFLSEEHLVDWLDTVQELLSIVSFNRGQRDDIINTLWDVISHRRSDIALKWWYGHLNGLQSRL